jgi:hypothetical protein
LRAQKLIKGWIILKSNKNCRLELVSARCIKRMPGLQAGATREGVVKNRDFVKKRGYCKPVVLSDSDGCMTLLSGAATFEAYLDEKGAKIPAVIVKTGGEADNLMFALQSAELNEALTSIAASAAIVRLIDSHSVPRKEIIEALGKSPAWLNRMESLNRKLNNEVAKLVADGRMPARSAQEVARLPADVQMAFAISATNDLLSKNNVAYLVNRYLSEDTGSEERDRIINTPKLALPNDLKRRGRMGRDNSPSARLSRAIAGCLDGNAYLSNLLGSVDIGQIAVRIADVRALLESLAALHTRLLAVFPPGENKEGDAYD